MSWSTPKTWTTATAILKSDLDTFIRDQQLILKTSIDDVGNPSPQPSTQVTIDTDGILAVVQFNHTVDTFADASTDNLDNIALGAGTRDGMMLVLKPENVARVVTIRHNIGNIQLIGAANYVMNAANDRMYLHRDGTDWFEINRH